MSDDTPQPRWTLVALLRAPASTEEIEMLVARVRALAAADQAAREQAPDDDEDGHQRHPDPRP